MRAGIDPLPHLLQVCQSNDGESIMHLIRQLTAFEMLAHEDKYQTFLPALEGLKRGPMLREGEELTVPLVVNRLVVVNGMEAEHVMMQALSTLLHLNLGIVYAVGNARPQVRTFMYNLHNCCFHVCGEMKGMNCASMSRRFRFFMW
jgi:hypothetical protein